MVPGSGGLVDADEAVEIGADGRILNAADEQVDRIAAGVMERLSALAGR